MIYPLATVKVRSLYDSLVKLFWKKIPVKLQVVHPDTGELCKPDEMGEICLKGPGLLSHFLNRPEDTKEYFDEEGFGRTGDLGRYSADGQLFYVDRMKELIK